MVTTKFVNDEDRGDSVDVLRSHANTSRKIARVMNVSKEKSKAIAKRGRDAIVAAYKEDRI